MNGPIPGSGPMRASTRGSSFVPMSGPDQVIINLMHDHLVPVDNGDGTPVITGQEECAARIVDWLRVQGVDLP